MFWVPNRDTPARVRNSTGTSQRRPLRTTGEGSATTRAVVFCGGGFQNSAELVRRYQRNPVTHEVYDWIDKMLDEGLAQAIPDTPGNIDQYLALAQQNGITAIILGLRLETPFGE